MPSSPVLARRTRTGTVPKGAGLAPAGVAPNLGVLVAARLVQGAGAAVIVPASLALIREAYPDPARRARAMAIWAMGGSAGAAAGPVAGGVLSLISWGMIFFVNLPVGLLALCLLSRTARSPRRADAPFDWAGQMTAVAAMGGLTYAAIEAGAEGFGAPKVVLAFCVAVLAGVLFLVAQARGRNPMVPLSLLRTRTMLVSSAVGFALNTGFYGMVFQLVMAGGLVALGLAPRTAPTWLVVVVSSTLPARSAAPWPWPSSAPSSPATGPSSTACAPACASPRHWSWPPRSRACC
ncbi:MFS transporter [Streptomyces sp. NPDC020192]|uniref:MFS transporter n=1 Tax=Streptomyces sp. NPDC020192 TaxID=3365066 RepID=UPI00379A68E0